MFRKKLSLILIFAMLITILPINQFSYAISSLDYLSLKVKEESQVERSIVNGQENIKKELEYIAIQVDSRLTQIDSTKIGDIQIKTSNLVDEKYKFDIGFSNNELKLSIKESSGTRLYNLIDKKPYLISFPSGLFKNSDATSLSAAYNISFVSGNSFYNGYSPNSSSVELGKLDKSNSNIDIYFVDEVVVRQNQAGQEPFIKIEEIDYQAKTPINVSSKFTINTLDASKNIVRLSPISPYEIKDFTRYKVSLKDGAVYLASSFGSGISTDALIQNSSIDIIVESDRIISNQIDFRYPLAGATEVEQNPIINLKFKDKVEIIDKNKIKIIEKVNGIYLLSNPMINIDPSYITIDAEEKQVSIRLDQEGASKLEPSKTYQIYLEDGFVRTKEKTDYDNIAISNKSGYLGEFTTSSDSIGPVISKFSSDLLGSDDITKHESTSLFGIESIKLIFNEDMFVQSGKTTQDIINASKLYKLPKAIGNSYDSTGELYDTGYDYYREDQTVVSAVYSGTDKFYQEELGINSLSIQGNKILIEPKLKWEDQSQYRFILDKEFLLDSKGNKMASNQDFVFFTKEKEGDIAPTWIDAKTVEENNLEPYSKTNPIVLKVDSEVILNLGQRTYLPDGKINFTGLEGLKIQEENNSSVFVKIEKAEIRYDRDSSQKTVISLYPDSTLGLGTGYKLIIPEGTFQARNGKPLGIMNYVFSTKSDSGNVMVISSLSDNTINSVDLATMEKSFYIHGKNFDPAIINKIVIQGESGNSQDKEEIIIPKTDFVVLNPAKIQVTIKGAVKDKLSKEGYTGDFIVKLSLTDASELPSQVDKLKIVGRGTPKLIETNPSNGNMLVDEKLLKQLSGKDRSYIRFTFEDKDGLLDFNYENGLSLLKSSRLYSNGSETNLVDLVYLSDIENKLTGTIKEKVEAELFKKEPGKAHLYIPIKELRSNTKYFMHIDGNLVRYDLTTTFIGSDPYDLNFATMSVPVVTRIDRGTISEDYDEDEPLVIYGDFFLESSLKVYFNDEEARKIEIKQDKDKNSYINVYLPDGKNKLEPGTYNVQVRNSDNHTTTEFGVLSVIKESDKQKAPDDDYRYEEEIRLGEIVKDVKLSSDTLLLNRRYTDESEVYLDLNKIFGTNTKIANIKFRGSSSNIGELQFKSLNFDMIMYRVRGQSSKDANVRVGVADETLKTIVSRKLVGYTPVSEFIQVSGEYYEMNNLVLEIPLKSISPSMKVLRYDEKTRSLYDERFVIDRESKKARILSNYKGVFIVVD